MVIQQVYLKDLGYSLYIKSIKPDENNPSTGTLIFNGNPTKLERQESYLIKGNELITENFTIPMEFIINFLVANDSVIETEDGKLQVVLREVPSKQNT